MLDNGCDVIVLPVGVLRCAKSSFTCARSAEVVSLSSMSKLFAVSPTGFRRLIVHTLRKSEIDFDRAETSHVDRSYI